MGRSHSYAATLKVHSNLGHTPNALKEVMSHIAHYASWPTGMNGLRVLQEVVAARGLDFEEESEGV